MPRKLPNGVLVCLGKFQSNQHNISTKTNYPVNCLLVCSIVLHGLAWFRIKFYKRKYLRVTIATIERIHQPYLNSQTLVNFSTNAVHLLLMILAASFVFLINEVDPNFFLIYPYYIWLYFLHHIKPCLMLSGTLIIYYLKNRQLRKYVWLKFDQYLLNFKHWKMSLVSKYRNHVTLKSKHILVKLMA